MGKIATLAATGLLVGALLAPMLATCADKKSDTAESKSIAAKASGIDFEAQVEEYLRLFPYQETYRYVILQTIGD